MIEVEVKLKIENINLSVDNFLNLGFERKEYVQEKDTYYTVDFHDFKAADEALRIRESKNLVTGQIHTFVTYKGKKLDNISMSRKELETEVMDSNIIAQIFESIGFKPVTPVVKTRTSLYKDNITVCIDDVKGLGEFLEVEILVENESMRENALAHIEQLLDSMGISMKNTIRKSYLSMLEDIAAI